MSTLRRRADFTPLTVSAVRPLTSDSVEVVLAVPESLVDDFHYEAGQYVALRAHLGGEELRRSYSLCGPPTPGELRIGVKRDRGGRFSTWATTELQPGDVLDVMKPLGSFVSRKNPRHVVAVAAGSGITPVLAIITSLLRDSEAQVDLIYANRATADVMFAEAIGDLKDRYPARFAVHHVLTREQRVNPLLSGRLDDERLTTLLDMVGADVDEWFLCGPFELVQLTRDLLAARGVPDDDVRFELFASARPTGERSHAVTVHEGEDTVSITFRLDGTTSTVVSPRSARESVLAAALRTRPDVPFACAGGVCGTCRAKVVAGEFTMDENYALEREELAAGYVLTCQTHPTSGSLSVDYDA